MATGASPCQTRRRRSRSISAAASNPWTRNCTRCRFASTTASSTWCGAVRANSRDITRSTRSRACTPRCTSVAAQLENDGWQRLPGVHGMSTVLPGQAPNGAYILSVLLKRSFAIVHGEICQPLEQHHPLAAGDVFWVEPGSSTVRYESDFVPFKLATDVVLNGTVHAPDGVATTACF